MKYAISFKTSDGVTVRSEVMPFETDQEALAYTHAQASKCAIVEAWKDDNLLIRLEQPNAAAEPKIAARETNAPVRNVGRAVR